MRRFALALALALAACADASRPDPLAPSLAIIVPGPRVFTAVSINSEVVPPTQVQACGHTFIEIFDAGTADFRPTLYYRTRITNPTGETFVAGHLHHAPAGQNDPNVYLSVFFFPSSATSIDQSGFWGLTQQQYDEIRQAPGDFYVDFHTTSFPNGAIRGQLAAGKKPRPTC